jgi:uncharacterized membrane protein HdeD (DUF308 family)
MSGSFSTNPFHGRLHGASNRLLWFGIALMVVGLAAILFPFFSSLAATVLAGWVMFVAGILAISAAFTIHGTGPFFGAVLFGLLSLAAGVFMLFNPLAGVIALTLVVGVMFLFQGAAEIVFALEMRPMGAWGSMLFSGIASIVLAIIIIAGWPATSVMVLGILLGINFLTSGLGYIFTAQAMRRLEQP